MSRTSFAILILGALVPGVAGDVGAKTDPAGMTAEDYVARARRRMEEFHFRSAAQDYRRAIAIDPLNATAYLEMGRVYALAGKTFHSNELLDLAVETLSSADPLGQLPDLPEAAEPLLADMLFELGMLEAWRASVANDAGVRRTHAEHAITRLLQIEDEFRDRSLLHLALADLYRTTGDIPKACTAAREAAQGIAGDNAAQMARRERATRLEQEVCVTATGYDPNR